jgi:putative zinc finger protein
MASRERHDAMAGLLKRSLAGDAGAGKDCPEPDILAAYFERSLDADETAHVEFHLSECARCRDQLAALGRAEEAAATQVVETPHRQPRASWLWDWRWLAPVAAVLVIAAVWATRRPELTRIAEQPMSAVATPQPALQAPPAPPAALKRALVPPTEEKKQLPSRVVAAPALVTPPPKPPTLKESVAVNSVETDKSVEVEHSPLQNLQSSRSIRNLPLAGRNYVPLDSLSKSAPAVPRSSADQAATATTSATTESVTVESAAGPVATAPSAAPPPAAPKVANGTVAGAAGGVVAEEANNAKRERAAMKRQDFAQVVVTQQSTEQQRAASFIVHTPDSKILWRIGRAGFVERSGDGGLTWNGTLPKQNAHYNAGSAPSAKVCWLVGNDEIILLTQDAANWQTIPPPMQTNFIAIAARDAWTATVTTADGRKFTTTNQGESWTPAK